EAAASAGLLGGLSASGWHSCCILMRMLTDAFIAESDFLGAPGGEEVRCIAPLRPGERVTARTTVLDTRESKSRPEMGFVKFRFDLLDGAGKQLMTLIISALSRRRDRRHGEGGSGGA